MNEAHRRLESLFDFVISILMAASAVIAGFFLFATIATFRELNWPCGFELPSSWLSSGCGSLALAKPKFFVHGVPIVLFSAIGASFIIFCLLEWRRLAKMQAWILRMALSSLACALAAFSVFWTYTVSEMPLLWSFLGLGVSASAFVVITMGGAFRSPHFLGCRGNTFIIFTFSGLLCVAAIATEWVKVSVPDIVRHDALMGLSNSELVGTLSHSSGNSNSNLTFVLFLDPSCKWSLMAYLQLRKIISDRPDTRLIVRPFSLKGDRVIFALSEKIDQLPEADFWPYLDRLAKTEIEDGVRNTPKIGNSIPGLSSYQKSSSVFITKSLVFRMGGIATPLVFVIRDGKSDLARRTGDFSHYL